MQFKKACENGALKDMLECQLQWGEQQMTVEPAKVDANYFLCSSIMYAYNFILTRKPEFYDRMLSFYRDGINNYKPENPALFDWFKSEAEIMISKVDNIK